MNETVYPGAKEVGYDYSFIQAATNDRVPCIFIENGKESDWNRMTRYMSVISIISRRTYWKDNPELLRMHPSVGHAGSIVNGVPRIGFRKAVRLPSGKMKIWLSYSWKAKGFLKDNKDKPFFLYYGLHRMCPVYRIRSLSANPVYLAEMIILEADWCVTEFLKELDKLGLTENTLVILTSDNSSRIDDGYQTSCRNGWQS